MSGDLNSFIDAIDTMAKADKSDNFWRAVVNDIIYAGMETDGADGTGVYPPSVRHIKVIRPGQADADPTYYPVVSSPMPAAGDDVWMYSPGGDPAICLGIAIPNGDLTKILPSTADATFNSTSKTVVTGCSTYTPQGVYTITGKFCIENLGSTASVGCGVRVGGTMQPYESILTDISGAVNTVPGSWDVFVGAGELVELVVWQSVATAASHKVKGTFSRMELARRK